MSTRRSILAGAFGALAAPWGAAWPALAAAAGGEHSVPGGTGGIQRAQYGFTATKKVSGIGMMALPASGSLYMVPLSVQAFDESAGAKYQLEGGLVTVLKDGLYDVTANVDWATQARAAGVNTYDSNSRKLLVQRVPVGVAPPKSKGGKMALIKANAPYDSIAGHDTAGSSVPNMVRASQPWSPGTIAAGGFVSTQIALPTGSFAPAAGDLLLASHTGLDDGLIGSANAGLIITAGIAGPGLARVVIENRYNAGPVTVPAGTLSVVAESAVSTAGGNANAWIWERSGRVDLLAGEKLLVAVRSETDGDFLQVDSASFLRIRNVVA